MTSYDRIMAIYMALRAEQEKIRRESKNDFEPKATIDISNVPMRKRSFADKIIESDYIEFEEIN